MAERAAKQPRLDPEVAANVIIQFESAEGEHAGMGAHGGTGSRADSLSASPVSSPPSLCSVPACAHTGPTLDVPHTVTPQQLEVLLNGLLQNEEKMPYSFYIEGQVCAFVLLCLPLPASLCLQQQQQQAGSRRPCFHQPPHTPHASPPRACPWLTAPVPLVSALLTHARLQELAGELGGHLAKNAVSVEQSLRVVYMPQAVFRVRPVARCTASMAGHSESVLVVAFSPDGRRLATGSGDTTLRFWDLNTQLPQFECKVRQAVSSNGTVFQVTAAISCTQAPCLLSAGQPWHSPQKAVVVEV
jgi:hypothetical protein